MLLVKCASAPLDIMSPDVSAMKLSVYWCSTNKLQSMRFLAGCPKSMICACANFPIQNPTKSVHMHRFLSDNQPENPCKNPSKCKLPSLYIYISVHSLWVWADACRQGCEWTAGRASVSFTELAGEQSNYITAKYFTGQPSLSVVQPGTTRKPEVGRDPQATSRDLAGLRGEGISGSL